MSEGNNKNSVLPKVLLDVFDEGKAYNASGDQVTLHSNISCDEALQLYKAVKDLNPTVSAEVGFAQGVSTMAILQALHDNSQGTHHVIDPFQDKFGDVGLAMVERANLSGRLKFYRQFADEVIPQLPEIDFGFIDSSHLFDLTINEFVMMDRKLKVGGIVGFHDMWMPSLRKVVRYILENRRYEVVSDQQSQTSPTTGQRVKYSLMKQANLIPGGKRIFNHEVLKPWNSLRINNLVLLRKTGADDREWTFHNSF